MVAAAGVHRLPYRSLLFVPAHDRQRLAAAFSSGADAVVADLEDAVPPDRKDEARRVVAELLPDARGAARLVRVNPPETGLFEVDLAAIAGLELDAIALPKATPESVLALGAEGPPIVAVIESAQGLRRAYDVASLPRVAALVLGAGDLALDLRLEPRPDALELLYARSKLVADSAAAGIRAPFDRVYPRYDDPEGLESDARFARSLGFGGKACADPAQPATVNRVFEAFDREAATAAKAALFKHQDGRGRRDALRRRESRQPTDS
jgi:citrate lyase beta subunit